MDNQTEVREFLRMRRAGVTPAEPHRRRALACAGLRTDIVAINPLGRALMAPMLDDPVSRRNIARFTFFSPLSAVFYPHWEQGADAVVASLRRAAGQNPHDKGLTDLIGELVTRSDPFRVAGRPTMSASAAPAPNASAIPSR
jgi:hypothetical protein